MTVEINAKYPLVTAGERKNRQPIIAANGMNVPQGRKLILRSTLANEEHK